MDDDEKTPRPWKKRHEWTPEQVERFRRVRAWLREAMDAREWSQAEMARRSGVTRGTINKYLRPNPEMYNARLPTSDSLVKLARGLGIAPEDAFAVIGIDIPAHAETDLQRACMNIVPTIPDEYLGTVYVLLRALSEKRLRALIERERRRLVDEETG